MCPVTLGPAKLRDSILIQIGRSIQFDLKVMGQLENVQIGRACPLLVVIKRLKPVTALSGTVTDSVAL